MVDPNQSPGRKPHGSQKESEKNIAHKVVKRGDIFWAALPDFGGTAQKGTRPVLVVQNDIGNRFSNSVVVASITSQVSSRQFPVNVFLPEGLLKKPSEVRTGQLHTLDKSWLRDLIAKAPKEIMAQVDEALCVSLGLRRR